MDNENTYVSYNKMLLSNQKELMNHATTRISLKHITLRERRPMQKTTYCMVPLYNV